MASNKERQRKNYNLNDESFKRMSAALQEAHSTPGPNIAQIARNHDVNAISLRRRYTGDLALKSSVGPSPLLNENDERVLVSFLELMADGGFGLNLTNLRTFVNEFLEKKHLNREISHAWITRFMKDNPELSNRMSENLSRYRLKAMSRPKLDDFYQLIENIYDKYGVVEEAIFNCDEAGFCCNPREGTIIAKRGARKVYNVVPVGDGNIYHTVHFCGNSLGQFIKPLIIFKGKSLKSNWDTDNFKDHFNFEVTPSGWMYGSIFVKWLETCFVPSARRLLPEGYSCPKVTGYNVQYARCECTLDSVQSTIL